MLLGELRSSINATDKKKLTTDVKFCSCSRITVSTLGGGGERRAKQAKGFYMIGTSVTKELTSA